MTIQATTGDGQATFPAGAAMGGQETDNERRRLCIYQSRRHYIAGHPPVNVSWVRSESAAEYLDRMLPGEWAVLWGAGGEIVDTATALADAAYHGGN